MADAGAKQAREAAPQVPARRPQTGVSTSSFERDVEQFFDDLLHDDRHGLFRLPAIFRRRFPAFDEMSRLARVDVYQTDDEVVVKAEMPGLAREDIDVSIGDSTLTIKGEKKREEKVEDHDYVRTERSFGMISRSIELPCEVAADRVTAKVVDGVLEVHAPKTESSRRKPVKVKIG